MSNSIVIVWWGNLHNVLMNGKRNDCGNVLVGTKLVSVPKTAAGYF